MTEPTASQAPCLTGEFRHVTEIMVPCRQLDRYDRALAVAAQLAARWEVPLRIVHVRLPDDETDSDQLESARAAFSNQHPEILIESTLVAGDDLAAAVRSVGSSTALVVMSSDHADRTGSPSAAEEILHSVGLAMVVGREADSEHVFGPVTVALDGSPTAEGALEAATAFAASTGFGVELVQVVDQATSAHVARLRHEGERVSESGYLQSVADRLAASGIDVRWRVVHNDDPIAGLLSTVEGQGGGPIVVGSHGDSGLTRRMLGSTAMGLVAGNTYPVLVVATGGRDEPELTQ